MKLVCDRCGADAGTCYHRFDSEYGVCSQTEYRRDTFIFRCLVSTILALVLGCFAFLYSW